MNQEYKKEISRRTEELRVAMTRSSTTQRRIIYLATALQKMVDPYPKTVFPEVWEVLDTAIGKFTRVTAAQAIFDAEVIHGS